MKNVYEMTKEELLALEPFLDERGKPCHVIIVPTKEMHESGYPCMKYVLLDKKHNVVQVTVGMSDVLHIEGKGANHDWISMDCLPESGCLHLWTFDPFEVRQPVYSDLWIVRGE